MPANLGYQGHLGRISTRLSDLGPTIYDTPEDINDEEPAVRLQDANPEAHASLEEFRRSLFGDPPSVERADQSLRVAESLKEDSQRSSATQQNTARKRTRRPAKTPKRIGQSRKPRGKVGQSTERRGNPVGRESANNSRPSRPDERSLVHEARTPESKFTPANLETRSVVLSPVQQARISSLTREAERVLSEPQMRFARVTVTMAGKRLVGVDSEDVYRALLRALAAHRNHSPSLDVLRASLRSELRQVHTAGLAERTAERLLKYAKLPPAEPVRRAKPAPRQPADPVESTPAMPVHPAPREVDLDFQRILQVLTTTDLATGFGTAVRALQDLFRAIHDHEQPHVTRVFLQALENQFALVVPKQAVQKSRQAFTSSSATLKDVQSLPTTRGIVLLDGGSRLSAWVLTPDTAEAASIELNALRTFLKSGALPTMTYEYATGKRPTTGAAMRDLAGFARRLREKDSGMLPLYLDPYGATRHDWTDKHFRRFGRPAPHRVREHLRTLPDSGRKTVVHEHARYGSLDQTAKWMRIRVL